MRVAIVGAGAMGCLFGGMLKISGQETFLVDVWQEHIQTINDSGLEIEQGDRSTRVDLPACLPENLQFVPDLVIVFTKSFQTEAALKGVERILSEQVYVLTLQNGLGHVNVIQKYVDRSKIIHGITTYPCDLIGPGHIRTKGEGHISLMSVDGSRHAMLTQVEALLNLAGFRCHITPEVETAIWEKVAFNAAMNALTAVMRLPVGALAESVEGRRLVERIVDEVVAVAHRKGIPADASRIWATLEMAFKDHKEHLPSMLQDIANKRRTEIDFINGAIVREAERLDMAVPVNATLCDMIKTIEHTYL